MRVLITGASGFLGRECVKQFKSAGYEVCTTDLYGDVDILGDLSNNCFVDSLPNVNVVVNCAAVQYVTKNLPFFSRKLFFEKNNILSAKNLSDKYKDSGCHFVHIGTSMMYRQGAHETYTIDSVMGGQGVYSESKVMAQHYINKIPKSASVIPCIIGGEGREGLFRGFVEGIKKFRIVVFPGNGGHKVNMVHVHDVASLILQVVNINGRGFYNAAAPDPKSIKDWIDEIQNEIGVDRVYSIQIPLRVVKLLAWLTGYRILAREQLLMLEFPHVLCIKESLNTGWIPKYSNSQIVRDIARYITAKA